MPIIPEALQKRRIQKPFTVRETAIVKQYGSLENKKEYDRQVALQKEVSDFNSNISWENYKERYNQLSTEAQALVKSPDVVFASPEYKQYQEYKAMQEKFQFEKNAYDLAMRVFDSKNAGAIFSLSSYFNKDPWVDRAREIYSDLKDQERSQKARSEYIALVRAGKVPGVEIRGSVLINTDTLKPITVSQIAEKYAAQQTAPSLIDRPTTAVTSIQNMPKVDTSLMSWKDKVKYYYQTADIKLGGYLPGGATPSDVKARNAVYDNAPSEYYFGDKVLSLTPTTTPTMGGAGTSITSFGMSDIKVEIPKTTVEQYILPPGTKIALTGFNKEIYLPDMASAEKLNQIIKYDDIKSYNKFVAEQQAQYKKDIGQYNALQAKLSSQEEVTQEEINKINTLGQKITTGYKGTLKDVTRTAVQERGTAGAAWLYGGLRAGQTAYGIEKTYLGFQLGGAVAGTLLPAGVTSAIAGSRTVSTLGRLYVPSLIGGAAVRTGVGYVKGEYAPEYLGESAGILFGGLGSYYSKQIVEGGWRFAKATGRGLRFVGERLGQTGYEQPTFRMGKRGSTQFLETVQEDVYIRDAEGRIIGIKKSAQKKLFDEYVNRGREYKTYVNGKEVTKVIYPTSSERLERARDFLTRVLKRNNPTEIKDAIKIIRDSLGDKLANDLLIQEGLLMPKVRATERPDALKFFDSSFGEKIKPTIQEPISPPQSPFYGRGLYERTDFPLPGRLKGGVKDVILGSDYDRRGASIIFGGLFGAGLGLGLGGRFANGQEGRFRTGLGTGSRFGDGQGDIERDAFATGSLFGTGNMDRFKQPQQEGQISTPVFRSPTPTEQPIIQEPGLGFPQPRPRRPEPRKPIEPTKKPFGFEIPEFERKKKGFIDKPYDAYARVDATKKTKARWVLVADNVPLVTALSKGGGFVDETASNRFKVEPAKGKLNRIVDVAWNSLSNKFREYSQKGGVKVGLRPGHYIEKRKYRIDSPNERRTIPQAGRVAIARKFGRI